MATIISDVRSGFVSLISSYLTLLLPISIGLTVLLSGAFHTYENSLGPIFVLVGLFYATVPAFAVTQSTCSLRSRIKGGFLAAGDALIISALFYFAPKPDYTTLTGEVLLSLGSGVLFVAINVLILRALRLAADVERDGLLSDIRLVWKLSPGLIVRMAVGLALPIGLTLGVLWVQDNVTMGGYAFHLAFGLVSTALLIVPSSFMPFILLAEGLKRAGIDERAAEAETTPEE